MKIKPLITICLPAWIACVCMVSPCVFSSPQRGNSAPARMVQQRFFAGLLPVPVARVQDARPMGLQRGVLLDGTLQRVPPAGMSLVKSPFPGVWQHDSDELAVLPNLGTYASTDVDLSLPAPGFSWVIGRSYNARQTGVTGVARDSNGYQGRNWFQGSQPELVLSRDLANPAEDVIYLIYGADCFVEFKRETATSKSFRGGQGVSAAVLGEAGNGTFPGTYTLMDSRGTHYIFFGFDDVAGTAAGQLWKIVDNAGNTAYVGDETSAGLALASGFDGQGRITKAYDSAGRRYRYSYEVLDGEQRLTGIIAEEKEGGTWRDPVNVATVAGVFYGYYGQESYGNPGDLKWVKVTLPMAGRDTPQIKRRYYRYWKGDFSEANPGREHALKLVFNHEECRAFDWQDGIFDEDYTIAATAAVEPFAAIRLEYDAHRRVSRARFHGQARDVHLTYESNPNFVSNNGYDRGWASRTVAREAGDRYRTFYYDAAGQPLHQIISSGDPALGVDARVTKVVRDMAGRVIAIHTPSNIIGYQHEARNVTLQVSPDQGLILDFGRIDKGPFEGLIERLAYRPDGARSDAYLLETRAYTRVSKTIGDSVVSRVYPAEKRVYRERGSGASAAGNLTEYDYEFYPDTLMPETVTTSLPVVSKAQNGSGEPQKLQKHFNPAGKADFVKQPDGTIDYREYHHGQMTELVRDADTNLIGPGQTFSSVSIPTGFTTTGTALHSVTRYTRSIFGPVIIINPQGGPCDRATYYSQLGDGRMVKLDYPRYDSGPIPRFYGPVKYTVYNDYYQVELEGTICVPGHSTTASQANHVDETDPDPINAIAGLGHVCRLTTYGYDYLGGPLAQKRVYFSIPASGEGSEGVNYDATLYDFDIYGQKERTKLPDGTIERWEFDPFGYAWRRWSGTNDAGFPNGEPVGPDNMTLLEELEYDNGSGIGYGYLTRRTLFVQDGATDARVFDYTNDIWGEPVLIQNPESPHFFIERDNWGRETARGEYSSLAGIVVGAHSPLTWSANRLTLDQVFYDSNDRIYKYQWHNIDPAGGFDLGFMYREYWFDGLGRKVKEDGASLVKYRYDGKGRMTHQFQLAVDDDTTYAEAFDVSGDIVLMENQTVYDTVTDVVVLEADIARHPDDFGVGETTGPLDTNNDGKPQKYTPANLRGRIQIKGIWGDQLCRPEEVVAFGDNGGAVFNRKNMLVPARSDNALRTTYKHGTDGTIRRMIDPKGVIHRYVLDQAGRTTKEIRNFKGNVNGGLPSGAETNATTEWTYLKGMNISRILRMPNGIDQVTNYNYGTQKGTAPGESSAATGFLLRSIQYPDSSGGADTVSFAYNAQKEEVYRRDQAGNVIESDYDLSGGTIARRVTALAPGFDGTVRRQEMSYNDGGHLRTLTQYSAVNGGSSFALDQMKLTYNGWGLLENIEQDRDSEIGTVGTVAPWQVGFYWLPATLGRNTLRKQTMTLPSSRILAFDYSGTGGRHDDESSRVTSLFMDGTTLVNYEYQGRSQLAATQYPEINVVHEDYDASTGTYPHWDRFDRPLSFDWFKNGNIPVYQTDLTYDRGHHVLSSTDHVHTGFDSLNDYDNLGRVISSRQGVLNNQIMSTSTMTTSWLYGHTGNWETHQSDLNGDGDFDDPGEVDERRQHNQADELLERDLYGDGSLLLDLDLDETGNLLDDGRDYQYEYDVFFRLRKIRYRDTGNPVAEYRYNAMGQRIGVHRDTDGDGDLDNGDDWFYFAYDDQWRMVARFANQSIRPVEEWINGSAGEDGDGRVSYRNEVVLYDRDLDNDTQFESRVYYLQNDQGDVVASLNALGGQLEMVRYGAYGTPFGLPGGDLDSDGDCDSADATAIGALIGGGFYDVRGDLDLDGDVDNADLAALNAVFLGSILGRQILSGQDNRKAHGGYEYDGLAADLYYTRFRYYSADSGRWLSRDPLGFQDGPNLYQYVGSNPLSYKDPSGLATDPGPGEGGTVDPDLKKMHDELYECSDTYKGLADCVHASPTKNTFRASTKKSIQSVSRNAIAITAGAGDGATLNGNTTASFGMDHKEMDKYTVAHEMQHVKDRIEGAKTKTVNDQKWRDKSEKNAKKTENDVQKEVEGKEVEEEDQ